MRASYVSYQETKDARTEYNRRIDSKFYHRVSRKALIYRLHTLSGNMLDIRIAEKEGFTLGTSRRLQIMSMTSRPYCVTMLFLSSQRLKLLRFSLSRARALNFTHSKAVNCENSF